MAIALNPTENILVIESADDLPDELSEFVLYYCKYDAGAGANRFYYTSDGSTLTAVNAVTTANWGP